VVVRFALRALLAVTVTTAVTLAASTARAEEPVVRYPPSTVRPRLIVGGIAVAGIAYGAAFLGAEAAPNWPGKDELKIPIVGPWITLGMNACPLKAGSLTEREPCDAFVFLRAGLLVIDGLLQAAGLAIVAEAIVMKTEAAPAAPAKAVASFTFHPAPFVTPTMTGFGFVGTF
jgi:hypothetical protein